MPKQNGEYPHCDFHGLGLIFSMRLSFKTIWRVVKTAGSSWVEDKAPRLGAALSYYTVFAIPPLFVIIIFVAGLVFDPAQVRSALFNEVGGLIGGKSAHAIESAMTAQQQGNKGMIASILAIATLIITATGLFIELQDALNSLWRVEPKPGQGILGFIKTRLLSFAMVVGIGFALLVSLVVSAGLSAFSKYVAGLMPGLVLIGQVANFAISFLVITTLFAMIFKVLPDVKIAWRDVWVGAAITSLLFTGGKSLLGMYLGKSTAVSAYGAAGSLVLLLLWVYYSAQILFFGAEVTRAYAYQLGTCPQPSKHAQWISAAQASAKAPTEAPNKKQKPREKPHRQAQLVSELKEEIETLRGVVKHRI
jgi:membrane protein